MNYKEVVGLLWIGALMIGCGDPNPLYCQTTADCRDPARPFCDVGGVHPGSDGLRNTCVPDPLILSVTVQGGGHVGSFPSGIDCPAGCEKSFPDGTEVVLTPTPDSGQAFTGWSGDCQGTSACTIVVNGPKSVVANFAALRTLIVTLGGSNPSSGSVVSDPPGIDCPGTCTGEFSAGTEVILTAMESEGGTFVGWSGVAGCVGLGSCGITVTQPQTVAANFDASHQFKWAKVAAAGGLPRTVSVAFDSQENLYAAGYFTSQIDFGSGPIASVGSRDAFVAKFDSSGMLQWLLGIGSSSGDTVTSVAVDSAGGVYVAFDFSANTIVGGVALVGPASAVAKLRQTDGSVSWVRVFEPGSLSIVSSSAVTVDSDGNVVFLGQFRGTARMEGAFAFFSSQGSATDVFVAWLSPTGGFVWQASYGGTDIGGDYGWALAPDSAGNVVVAGTFRGIADFNGNAPGGTVTSVGGADLFLAKVAPVSGFSWAVSFGTAIDDIPAALAVDRSDDLWLTGQFSGNIDFGGGALSAAAGQMYLVKLASDATHLLSSQYASVAPLSIASGERGNVSIVGEYAAAFNFGGGPVSTIGGRRDIFVANFDTEGNHRWSFGVGSSADPPFGVEGDLALAVAISPSGNVGVGGLVWDNADLGGGVISSSGMQPFVAVFGP